MRHLLVLLTFLYFYTFTLSSASAASPTDFPHPVPCGDTTNPEFHPLRPYPGSPCDTEIPKETTFSCGNNQAYQKSVTINPGEGQLDASLSTADQNTYHTTRDVHFDVALDLASPKIPFLGNTEDLGLSDADKANTYLSWYLNGTSQSLDQAPTPSTSPAPISILGLGDSITAGSNGPSYLCSLPKTFTFVGPKDVSCGLKAAGYSEAKSQDVYAKRADWLPSLGTSPITVLIHLGTNDVYHGVPTATTIANLSSIIATIKSQNPQATILLAKIIRSLDSDMTTLNEQIATLGGDHVTIVDANTDFDKPSMIDPTDSAGKANRVHPNTKGAKFIADKFLSAIPNSSSFISSPLSPIDRLINYSGPIKKLLPQESQQTLRKTLVEGPIDTQYHNYIVGCANIDPVGYATDIAKAISAVDGSALTANAALIGKMLDIGVENIPAFLQAIAISQTSGVQSAIIYFKSQVANSVAQSKFTEFAFSTLFPDAKTAASLIKASDQIKQASLARQIACAKGPDPTRLKDFRGSKDFFSYLVKYTTIPGFLYSSVNDWLDAQKLSQLFQNIPFASLEDTIGETLITLPASDSHPEEHQTDLVLHISSKQKDSQINVPHLRNINALSQILTKSFLPQIQGFIDPTDKDLVSQKVSEHQPPTPVNAGAPHSVTCTLSNLRVSDGDSLLGTQITGDLDYQQEFTYSIPTGSGGGVTCTTDSDCASRSCQTHTQFFISGPITVKTCAPLPSLTKDTTTDSWVFTKIPLIGTIYDTLINSKNSLLRRFTPQALTSEIPKDYTETVSAQSPNSPLVFPMLGSLSDNILGVGQANLNLQKLLRPQGFSSNTAPANYSPITGTTDPSCKACANYTFPSDELRNVFEQAASYYKVPASVLLGVFHNESGFKFNWDSGITRAASCPNCGVPGCNKPSNISPSGGKGPWQFLPGTWNSYQNAVVEAGIPGHSTPNICNIIDSTYAAAKKLHQESGGANQYATPTCWGTPYITGQGPSTSCDWDEKRIVTAVRQYLGYCEGQDKPENGTCYSSALGSCPTRSTCQADSNQCYQTSALRIALCQTSP